MSRLKLKTGQAKQTVEIPTGTGSETVVYEMRPLTLEVEEALDECAKAIDKTNLDSDIGPLERMEPIVEQLDAMLTREGAPAGSGKPQKPSELVLTLYKDGKVTGPGVKELVRELIQAVRPT